MIISEETKDNLEKKELAERGFDPRTSGLWAQHASTVPLCLLRDPRTLLIPSREMDTESGNNLTPNEMHETPRVVCLSIIDTSKIHTTTYFAISTYTYIII